MKRFGGMLVALWGLAACEPVTTPSSSGDFAVLARSAEGYEEAVRGGTLTFPQDHAAHPGYRIEWWYLTANLEDGQGRPWGIQWTLFRTATRPAGADPASNPWQDRQVYMAHMAVTSPDSHRAFQRYARGGEHGGLAQAGAEAAPFAAWLDNWLLESTGTEFAPLSVTARQGDTGFELQLDPAGPLVLQGDSGFSQKHPEGGGSWYYSLPYLEASGMVSFEGERVAVKGQAWLDREWSSQFLQPDQQGWDWLSLHLDSGEKLVLFQLRDANGGEPFRHGVLFDAAGRQQVLDTDAIEWAPVDRVRAGGRDLPLAWRVSLPEVGRQFTVSALHPDQWMDVDFPYWEGVVTANGEGAANSGRGYLELTGYPLVSD